MVLLVVLIVLAVVFGLGAVIKGLFWLAVIAIVLAVVAALAARSAFRSRAS